MCSTAACYRGSPGGSLFVVCFTVADTATPERVAAVVNEVARSGEAFLTPTVHEGVPALRAAFCNWRTTPADVDRIRAALGV